MTTSTIIRRGAAPLLALLATATLVPFRAEARPITGPPEPIADEFTLAAGEACTFDVDVTATGKAGAVLFDDGRAIYTAPGLKMTFSRLSATYAVNATGTFHDQPVSELPDGTFRWRTEARGHNLLFGPFEESGVTTAGARLYVGNVSLTLTFDPATGIVTFNDIDASAARVVDICAELA